MAARRLAKGRPDDHNRGEAQICWHCFSMFQCFPGKEKRVGNDGNGQLMLNVVIHLQHLAAY